MMTERNPERQRQSKADLELGLEHLKEMYEKIEPLLNNKMRLDVVKNEFALELQAQRDLVEKDLKVKQQYEDLLKDLEEIVDRAVKNLRRKEDRSDMFNIIERMKQLAEGSRE